MSEKAIGLIIKTAILQVWPEEDEKSPHVKQRRMYTSLSKLGCSTKVRNSWKITFDYIWLLKSSWIIHVNKDVFAAVVVALLKAKLSDLADTKRNQYPNPFCTPSFDQIGKAMHTANNHFLIFLPFSVSCIYTCGPLWCNKFNIFQFKIFIEGIIHYTHHQLLIWFFVISSGPLLVFLPQNN